MKKALLITTVLLMISLTACNKTDNKESLDTEIIDFSIDALTTSRQNKTTNNNSIDNNESNSYTNEFNELTIVGEDKTPSYKVIDNLHIEYNGTIYNNLYANVSKMEIPYDKTTFINFIVKTYNPTSEKVTTILSYDNDSSESSGVSLVDNIKSVWSGYDKVREKYNTDLKYQLTIYQGANNNLAVLITCKEYMVYKGKNGEMSVDMNAINQKINESN